MEDLTVAPMTNAYPVLAMAHRTASRKNREKAAFLNLHEDRGVKHKIRGNACDTDGLQMCSCEAYGM